MVTAVAQVAAVALALSLAWDLPHARITAKKKKKKKKVVAVANGKEAEYSPINCLE